MKNRSLATIFAIVLIDLLGFGIILPLLPFIAEQFNANPLQIGLLTATFSFFQLIASPTLGRLSDRFGRKKILIISQLGSMAGYILLGLAGSLTLLFVSRIIDGITGGNLSVAQAYIADVTDKKDRARGMGLLGAAFGVGFIFGPAIGGLLAPLGFWAPAFFAAFVAGLTVLATLFFLEESVNVKKAQQSPRTKFTVGSLQRVLTSKPVGFLVLVFFLINVAFSFIQGNFALWTEATFGYGARQIGWLFAFVGIGAVLTQLVILPRIIKHLGENRVMRLGIFCLALGFFGFWLLQHPYLFVITLLLIPFGNGVVNPTLQAIASEHVAPEEYGETLGILQSGGSLGRVIGPIIGGELFYLFGKDVPFLVAGVLMFLVFWLTTKVLSESRPWWGRILFFWKR